MMRRRLPSYATYDPALLPGHSGHARVSAQSTGPQLSHERTRRRAQRASCGGSPCDPISSQFQLKMAQ